MCVVQREPKGVTCRLETIACLSSTWTPTEAPTNTSINTLSNSKHSQCKINSRRKRDCVINLPCCLFLIIFTVFNVQRIIHLLLLLPHVSLFRVVCCCQFAEHLRASLPHTKSPKSIKCGGLYQADKSLISTNVLWGMRSCCFKKYKNRTKSFCSSERTFGPVVFTRGEICGGYNILRFDVSVCVPSVAVQRV